MNKTRENDFTTGKILGPLMFFAVPVLFAMFLQSMYGAVDLIIVGQFAESTDVSAVSTGSQIMMTLTNLIAGFSMGTTILLGRMIGEGNARRGGEVIGTSICLFLAMGLVLSALSLVGAEVLAGIMNAPEEAFGQTVQYIRICGAGAIVIISYNIIGSIFRGIGDSRTPLMTVSIACCFNILGDLLFVAVFHWGTKGAALATVLAQGISVVISLLLIRRKSLPFRFRLSMIRMNRTLAGRISRLGIPIAVEDLLVGASFLIILAIVNGLGLVASAGIGVAEKVCGFIMLVPSAFMQAMSAFVAQNIGAGKYDRAKQALRYAIGTSFAFAVVMFYVGYWHGNLLAGIFSRDPVVIMAGAEYLKAYAIDCLLTCFLFCMIGFYNGVGFTGFVMVQGLAGAFLVRVPVSYLMSRMESASLFRIGLAIPCSTVVQILMCLFYLRRADHVWKPDKSAGIPSDADR